jgi:peptidoglycan/xylan/chitin deacetylase (PgdA/CDA1 family)
VCERKSDPWELAVSPANFDEQLSFLKENFDVVTPDEIATAVSDKKSGSRKIAITFDDGFVDNYTNARPILESHQLPATFYMATQPLSTGGTYWWEDLEETILHTPKLPETLTLDKPKNFKFKFYSDAELSSRLREEIRKWTADKPIVNERVSLFFELWSMIQPLSFHDQSEIIRGIKSWAGTLGATRRRQVMTVEELADMNSSPLFTIGAHTVHHAMLAKQDEKSQNFEVRQSKNVIEKMLGQKVDGFAYPYGNYDSVTMKLLKDAGFRYAVTTESRKVLASENVMALPRVQVKNWNKKEFAIH